MNEYKFLMFYPGLANSVGFIIMKANSLPAHLDICMEAKNLFPKAVYYRWDKSDEEVRIDLKQRLTPELWNYLSSLPGGWKESRFEYVIGYHKGERGTIISFTNDRDGTFLTGFMDSGAYVILGTIDMSQIKQI